jgi:hypothetical protein
MVQTTAHAGDHHSDRLEAVVHEVGHIGGGNGAKKAIKYRKYIFKTLFLCLHNSYFLKNWWNKNKNINEMLIF